jgi:molybdenum cofactor cytidylyltransferase
VNPDYLNGSMLVSLQKGILATNNTKSKAFMIFLGDQPSVQVETIQEILKAYKDTGSVIVAPSYHFHLGHPWLVDSKLWSEILGLSEPSTLRDFLRSNKKSIQYVTVNSQTILQDIDTPEQYSKIITS